MDTGICDRSISVPVLWTGKEPTSPKAGQYDELKNPRLWTIEILPVVFQNPVTRTFRLTGKIDVATG